MKDTILYNVHRFLAYPVTTAGDDEDPPVYGDPVRVPGINQVALDPEIVEATLKGDGTVIDTRSVLEAVTLSWTYGKLAPDALAVLDGGTATTDGEGTTRYVRTSDDQLPEFGVACLVSEVDNPGGAAKLYVYRNRITGGGIFAAQMDSHGQPNFTARAIRLEDEPHAIWAVDLEDTGTALPANGAALLATREALTD